VRGSDPAVAAQAVRIGFEPGRVLCELPAHRVDMHANERRVGTVMGAEHVANELRCRHPAERSFDEMSEQPELRARESDRVAIDANDLFLVAHGQRSARTWSRLGSRVEVHMNRMHTGTHNIPNVRATHGRGGLRIERAFDALESVRAGQSFT